MLVFKSLDVSPKLLSSCLCLLLLAGTYRDFLCTLSLLCPLHRAECWGLPTSPFFSLFHDFKTPRCQVPVLPFWLLLVSPGDLCSCWMLFPGTKTRQYNNTPQNDVVDESWTKKLLRHHWIALGPPCEPRHDLFMVSLISGAGFWGYLELHRDKGQPPLWVLEYHEKVLGSYRHYGTPVPALTSPPAAC